MSAKPTPLTTYPPSKPVWWLCSIYGGRLIHVQARFWIDAREEAARQAGCAPEHVFCQRDSEDDAQERLNSSEHLLKNLGPSPRLTAWQYEREAR